MFDFLKSQWTIIERASIPQALNQHLLNKFFFWAVWGLSLYLSLHQSSILNNPPRLLLLNKRKSFSESTKRIRINRRIAHVPHPHSMLGCRHGPRRSSHPGCHGFFLPRQLSLAYPISSWNLKKLSCPTILH